MADLLTVNDRRDYIARTTIDEAEAALFGVLRLAEKGHDADACVSHIQDTIARLRPPRPYVPALKVVQLGACDLVGAVPPALAALGFEADPSPEPATEERTEPITERLPAREGNAFSVRTERGRIDVTTTLEDFPTPAHKAPPRPAATTAILRDHRAALVAEADRLRAENAALRARAAENLKRRQRRAEQRAAA